MWLFRQAICLKGGHGTGKTENLALTFSDREKTGNFFVLTSIYCIRAVSWTVAWCMKPYHCYGKLHVLVIKILTIVQLSRIERGKGGWQDVFLNSTDQIQSTTNHFCKNMMLICFVGYVKFCGLPCHLSWPHPCENLSHWKNEMFGRFVS